jgi:hypothetical protein
LGEENANIEIKVYQSQWTPHIKQNSSTWTSITNKTWSTAKEGERINFNPIMGHNGPNHELH